VRSMPYEKRPHADEDKSVMFGTIGFLAIGAVVIILAYLFGWI